MTYPDRWRFKLRWVRSVAVPSSAYLNRTYSLNANLIRAWLFMIFAATTAGTASAQCHCPEIDSVAVGAFKADPDCVDAWFKHYRDKIPLARNATDSGAVTYAMPSC